MNQSQSHLKILAADISPYVLMPGDPARVDIIGKYFDNFRIISNNREFKVGAGNYRGVKITVCSTGIGCPSTAVATEELINAGARYLIRVGTCGGAWRADIPVGSLIIPTACVRDEGTTVEYVPRGFPAVADFNLVSALSDSARQNKFKYFIGINRTHDAFYGAQAAVKKWGGYLLDERWQKYDTPILSSEMECAALFIVASLRGVKAGAILAVNSASEPLKDRLVGVKQEVATESGSDITNITVDNMIRTALETLCSLKN